MQQTPTTPQRPTTPLRARTPGPGPNSPRRESRSPASPRLTRMQTAPGSPAARMHIQTQVPGSPRTPQPGSPSPRRPAMVSSPSSPSPHHPQPPSHYYTSPSEGERDRELARRHTTPAAGGSPRRGAFLESSPSRVQLLSHDEQGATSSRRGSFLSDQPPIPMPTRVRSRTEPALAGHSRSASYSSGLSAGAANRQEQAMDRDSDREWEAEMEVARRRGHARKSSAYAALAALSGLPPFAPQSQSPNGNHAGYGTAHHAYPAQSASAVARRATTQGQGQTTSPGSTPPLTADVRDEDGDADNEGDGDGDDEGETSEEGSLNRRNRSGKLLTPPATPPRHSLVVVAGHGEECGSASSGECSSPHHLQHPKDEYMHLGRRPGSGDRPTFNARKASAQCRQLEGYVSFAAVEGLGEPPSPGEGEFADADAEDPSKRKRGSLSTFAGLWRSGFW